MKKFLGIALVLAMVLAFSVPAMAASVTWDETDFTAGALSGDVDVTGFIFDCSADIDIEYPSAVAWFVCEATEITADIQYGVENGAHEVVAPAYEIDITLGNTVELEVSYELVLDAGSITAGDLDDLTLEFTDDFANSNENVYEGTAAKVTLAPTLTAGNTVLEFGFTGTWDADLPAVAIEPEYALTLYFDIVP